MISKEKLDNLSTLLLDVGKKMRDKLAEETKKNGLTMVSLATLKFIEEQGSPTMKDISDRFGVTPPSATATIEALAESRYLNRDLDKQDRRSVRLTITDKGREMLKKNLLAVHKRMETVFSKMEEDEIDNLYSGLKHFSEVIKKK